ncbi:MAG TPA: VWA domain-containing protein [Bryobacteraceae bacterium]|nr:VWA domain-containing protein [Bryobacteraceae bacterium]
MSKRPGIRIFGLGFLVVAISFGLFSSPRTVSSDQLQTIINSGLSKGQSDAQIAHSLADVEPSGHISEDQRTAMLALTPGPRTRDLVQILSDASAFVDSRPEEGDAPAASEQSEILARAHRYVREYIRDLPDFICTRLTRRFDSQSNLADRPEVWQGLRFRDASAGQLTFNRGVESYIEQSAGNNETRGLSSIGEFGSMIGALFLPDSHVLMSWAYWETLAGTRVAVFQYSVDKSHSRYQVGVCCRGEPPAPITVTVGYRGELYVDPATGRIWRVTRRALNLPRAFPTRRVDTIVDYQLVRIGEDSYLCPVRSSTFSETNQVHYLSEMRFVRYRRFTAEAKLVTDEKEAHPTAPDPAPAEEAEPWLEPTPSNLPGLPDPKPAAVEPPPAPSPNVTIRSSTHLVEVPVVVTDKLGVPVQGLKREDFEVFDNGTSQDVKLLVEDQPVNAAAAPRKPERLTFSNFGTAGGAPNQSSIILLDWANTDWADLVYARSEVTRFLHGLPSGQPIGIYLMFAKSFRVLSEPGQTSAANLADRLSTATSDWFFNGAALRGTVPHTYSRLRCEYTLDALTAIAKHLAGLPGRKNVFGVSTALEVSNARESCQDLVEPAAKELNNAGVAIYSVDAPGLKTSYAEAGARRRRSELKNITARQATLAALAGDTGGRVFLNANDLTGALRTAFNDTRGSYRVGYYPALRDDGQYHRIRVAVASVPDSRVRYREGYFDRNAIEDKQAAIRAAYTSPAESVGIALTAEVTPVAGRCDVNLNIDLNSVTLQNLGNRWTGKLGISVVQREDEATTSGLLKRAVTRHLDQTVGLQLRSETYDRAKQKGFAYLLSVAPEPGAASVRIVVRDPPSGAIGTVTIPATACSEGH